MVPRLAAALIWVAAACALACSNDAGAPSDISVPDAAAGGNAGSAGAAADAAADAAPGPRSYDDPAPPSDRTARPSAACSGGNVTPPRGTQYLESAGGEGRYYLALPPGYDPSEPH